MTHHSSLAPFLESLTLKTSTRLLKSNCCRVKFGKRELLVNGNFTSLVNGNPILLQIYALDFIQTHVNLELDTCIFTGGEKYIIFDTDYERYNAKLKY